jgi:hypothetical protein
VMAFFEAMRGSPCVSGTRMGDFLESPAEESIDGVGTSCVVADSSKAVFGARVEQSYTKALLSLLRAWKGSFENVLGELDQVLTVLWVGLMNFGLDRGPVERKMGLWAFKCAQPPRKAKAKACSRGPRKLRPVYEPRSAPTLGLLVIPLMVGLVIGLLEMMTEVLTTDSPMVGPVSGFLESIPVGFGFECSGCGDGVILPLAVVQIMPIVQVLTYFFSVLNRLSDVRSPTLTSSFVLARHSDGGILKPTKSLRRGFLNRLPSIAFGPKKEALGMDPPPTISTAWVHGVLNSGLAPGGLPRLEVSSGLVAERPCVSDLRPLSVMFYKPMWRYSRKLRGSRFLKMDNSLIIEAVSSFRAPPESSGVVIGLVGPCHPCDFPHVTRLDCEATYE